MPIFTLTMFPASDGDFLVLRWGDDGTAAHHAIIDLGRTADFKARRQDLKSLTNVELFVMSHIDADHIGGAIPFVEDEAPVFDAKQVWFNSYHHLVAAKKGSAEPYEHYSAKQGEVFSAGIIKQGWRDRWNQDFDKGVISRDTPGATKPITLAGGLTLHLLSPTHTRLAALEDVWVKELAEKDLRPGDVLKEELGAGYEVFGTGVPDVEKLATERFKEDEKAANGSSIALLAEFKGRRVLLAADAFPSVMVEALRDLGYSKEKRLPLACLKLSHHGSKSNTSQELLALLDCTCFAISTNGKTHNHPDPEAIARLLVHDRERPKQLHFNYLQPRTKVWRNARLRSDYRYDCIFPQNEQSGVTIDLLA